MSMGYIFFWLLLVRTQVENVLVTMGLWLLVWLHLFLIQVPFEHRMVFLTTGYILWTHFFRITPVCLTVFSILALTLYFRTIPFEFIPILSDAQAAHSFSFFIVIGSLVTLASLAVFLRRLPTKWKQPLIWLWSYYVILPFFIRLLPLEEDLRILVKQAWLLFGHSWWYFIFLLQNSTVSGGNPLTLLGFLFPISQYVVGQKMVVPMVLGPQSFLDYENKGELTLQRRRCIGFLVGTLGFTLIPFLQRYYLPEVSPVFDFTKDFFSSKISFHRYLAFGALNYVSLYAYYFGIWNLMAALFRMGGYHYPAASSFQVLRSRDFIDFFSSLVIYIKELYSQLFFYPVFFVLNRIVNLRVRVLLSTVLSFSLGVTLYFFSIVRFGASPLFEKGFFYCLFQFKPEVMVNCILMGFAISLSQWRRLTVGMPKERRGVAQVFSLLFYFSFFYIVFLVEVWPSGISFGEIIRKYRELISL